MYFEKTLKQNIKHEKYNLYLFDCIFLEEGASTGHSSSIVQSSAATSAFPARSSLISTSDIGIIQHPLTYPETAAKKRRNEWI
jgi:hypothetical protein